MSEKQKVEHIKAHPYSAASVFFLSEMFENCAKYKIAKKHSKIYLKLIYTLQQAPFSEQKVQQIMKTMEIFDKDEDDI